MAEKDKKQRFQKLRYTEAADSQYKEQILQNIKTETNLKEKRKQMRLTQRLNQRSLRDLDSIQIKKNQMSVLNVKIKNFEVTNISERERYFEIPLLPQDKVFDEKKEVHNTLTNIRKRYDEVKRIQQGREYEIEVMKRQLDTMKLEENMLLGEKQKVEMQVEDIGCQLETIRMNLRKQIFDKNSLEHMLTRYKKDLIQYQLRSSRLLEKQKKS